MGGRGGKGVRPPNQQGEQDVSVSTQSTVVTLQIYEGLSDTTISVVDGQPVPRGVVCEVACRASLTVHADT